MATSVSFKLEGGEKLARSVRALGDVGPVASAKGLVRLAAKIMRDAKEITPVDTGVLRASGTILPPEQSLSGPTVTMGFGGAASEYALIQHENLLYKHDPPGQALYLETALRRHAPEVADEMREAIDEFLEQWEEATVRSKLMEAEIASRFLAEIGLE